MPDCESIDLVSAAVAQSMAALYIVAQDLPLETNLALSHFLTGGLGLGSRQLAHSARGIHANGLAPSNSPDIGFGQAASAGRKLQNL